LTDPGGGPSLRERGRDMRNLRYADVLGLLEAGAILGYLSRKAPSRIGDAVYYRATPEDAPPDAQAPVTSRRTLHLRAGLAALGPGGANDGQKSSPFASLARPPNGAHSAVIRSRVSLVRLPAGRPELLDSPIRNRRG